MWTQGVKGHWDPLIVFQLLNSSHSLGGIWVLAGECGTHSEQGPRALSHPPGRPSQVPHPLPFFFLYSVDFITSDTHMCGLLVYYLFPLLWPKLQISRVIISFGHCGIPSVCKSVWHSGVFSNTHLLNDGMNGLIDFPSLKVTYGFLLPTEVYKLLNRVFKAAYNLFHPTISDIYISPMFPSCWIWVKWLLNRFMLLFLSFLMHELHMLNLKFF